MSQRVAAGSGAAATRTTRGSIPQRVDAATWPTLRCRRAASRPGRAGGPGPAPGLAHRKNPGSGMQHAATARPAADSASRMIHLGEDIRARSAEAGAGAELALPWSSPEGEYPLPCIPRAPPPGPRTALPGTGGIPSLASPVPRHFIPSVPAAERPEVVRRGRREKAVLLPRPRLRATGHAGPLRKRSSPAAAAVHTFAAGPGSRAQ